MNQSTNKLSESKRKRIVDRLNKSLKTTYFTRYHLNILYDDNKNEFYNLYNKDSDNYFYKYDELTNYINQLTNGKN